MVRTSTATAKLKTDFINHYIFFSAQSGHSLRASLNSTNQSELAVELKLFVTLASSLHVRVYFVVILKLN